MTAILELLPFPKVDDNIHRLIEIQTSKTKIFKTKIDTNSKLFLEFIFSWGFLSLLKESGEKRRKEVAKLFKIEVMYKRVLLAVKHAREFEEAGIEAFWRDTDDGKLEILFFLNLNKVAEGLDKKIDQLAHHKVAPIMNQFLKKKSFPPKLFEFKEEGSDVANVDRFFVEIEKTGRNWKASQDFEVQPNCHLMKFQKKTVQWMIDREQTSRIEGLDRFANCALVQPPEGHRHPTPIYYYPSFGLFSESASLFSNVKIKGGILADDSGLGKTVEVVSLISSHRRETMDQDHKENAICEKMCGSKKDVKTTLIAVPEILINHWIKEIGKQNLKVKVYFGMDQEGYLNPTEIADYDVILISYETMGNELAYTDESKSQDISVTSLIHVKWWRFISDESQVLDSVSRPSQVCQLIESHNRWCITGTPIKEKITELVGMFKFIQFYPLNSEALLNILVKEVSTMIIHEANLSKNSLLIKLTSQIMRRTRKETVRWEMGIPKMTEVKRIFELTPIEDFRHKKALEDVTSRIECIVRNSYNWERLGGVKGNEEILGIIEDFKQNMLSDGEHDEKMMLKNIEEELSSEPRSCMIRKINEKKLKVVKVLEATIENLLKVAEVHLLIDDSSSDSAYEKVVEVYEIIDELNVYCEQLKTPEVVEDPDQQFNLDRIQKPNRKRGPPNELDKPWKNQKLSVLLAAAEKARKDIKEFTNKVALPISINEKLKLRFLLNMLNVHKEYGVLNNAIKKMGGMDKLMKNLYSTIDRFSKRQRDAFQIMTVENKKLFKEWDVKRNGHEEISETLKKIGDSYPSTSDTLTTALLASDEVKATLIEMPFWPVFQDSQQHFEDGRLGSTSYHRNIDSCMGVCNQKSLQQISENYQLSTNHQLIRHVIHYITRLEKLRSEVFHSYALLIVFIQKFCNSKMLEINLDNGTILCPHENSNLDDIILRDAMRKDIKIGIPCQICSTKFSLAHLSFELGIGDYHGSKREVLGKSAIEKFLAKLLAIEGGSHPYSDQFSDYIERLRRTVLQIQSGCSIIVEFSDSLRRLFFAMRCYDRPSKQPAENLKELGLEEYKKTSEKNQADLRKLCVDFRYLIKVYLNESLDNDCPVCMENWTSLPGFIGFPCGHRVCQTCWPRWKKNSYEQNVPSCLRCSTCRRVLRESEIFVARENNVGSNHLIPGVRLTGKLEETIKLLREIGQEENVVVFTSVSMATSMGRYLLDVFEKAELPFINGSEIIPNGSPFEFTNKSSIVFCSLSTDLVGLDFSQANHVIFLDPTDSFSDFQRAMGRVFRYGQKHEVDVYYMSNNSSIDDGLWRMCRLGKGKEWLVKDIRKMFGIQHDYNQHIGGVMRPANFR